MDYFRPVFLFFVLFLLTSAFCWLANGLFIISPLIGIFFFPMGALVVVMLVDSIRSMLFP